MTDLAALKHKLATCLRLMAMEGLVDFNGHVSVRWGTDRLLINSRYSPRAGTTVDDIVVADMDGRLVDGRDEPPSETVIHTEVYRARPEVGSVAHLHPHFATVFTIAGRPLVPVYIVASLFGPAGVPVFDDPRLIRSAEDGRAVAAALGAAPALLLRAHGAVVVAGDIEGAFAVAYALEDNARKALAASALGQPRPLAPGEMQQYGAPVSDRGTKRKIWNFHVEKARATGWLEKGGRMTRDGETPTLTAGGQSAAKSEVDELERFRAQHPNVGLHFKDLKTFPVHHRRLRGTGGAWFDLAGNRTIEAHVSEIPPGGHNKKHRHMNEAIIYIVAGRGYSTIQVEGQPEERYDWDEGDMFSPPLNAWHQHFNLDPERPARYLAITNIGLMTSLGAFSKEQAPGQE